MFQARDFPSISRLTITIVIVNRGNHGRVVFYKAEISGFFINCDIKSYDDYENLLCIHV